jgi:hypothetical protein
VGWIKRIWPKIRPISISAGALVDLRFGDAFHQAPTLIGREPSTQRAESVQIAARDGM